MLSPDQRVLSDIFPDVPDIAEDLCTIITNTFDTCTFRLLLPTEPRPGFSTDLLIRLETAGSRLVAVAGLQHLAHLHTPDLVPATLGVGSTTDAHGRQLEYSITLFLDGTTVLENVWGGLKQSNQRSLMESVLGAIGKLQKLPVHRPDARQFLQWHGGTDASSPPSSNTLVGGPDTGFHSGIKQLLEAFLGEKAAQSHACEIVDTSDGIAVRPASDEIDVIEFSNSDLDDLMNHAVFCHNDLEPRNILVKRVGDSDGGSYEVAAIIDWEMAGFFSFAYEFGLKDTLLGSSNLWFSWYSLFKEQTAALLPQGKIHEKLIKALGAIARSKDLTRPKNVGVRVRAKWIKRERLRMSPDARHGWVREDGAGDIPAFTKEDNSILEQEVLRELGYI
ncbi:hypothetical protein F4818DRAFT_408857, partial [Hypoxylon cercidicola]